MQQAMQHLLGIVAEQKQRVQDALRQEKQASQQLEDARVELQKIRSEAFERPAGAGVTASEGAGEELPAYSA